MSGLLLLIPIALGLGILALLTFFWALKAGQYDDLDGAAHRILGDDSSLEKRQKTSNSERKGRS